MDFIGGSRRNKKYPKTITRIGGENKNKGEHNNLISDPTSLILLTSCNIIMATSECVISF